MEGSACLSTFFLFFLRFLVLIYCLLMTGIQALAASFGLVGGMWKAYLPMEMAYAFFGVGCLYFITITSRLCTSGSCCCGKKKMKIQEAPRHRSTRYSFSGRFISEKGILKALYYHLFHRNGAFGRRGKYFHLYVSLFEMYEIPAQTYQAYSISQISLSPYPALLSALTIMVSCIWIVIAELRPSSTNDMKKTSRLLLQDIVTDIIIAILVPMYTLLPSLVAVVTDSAALGNDVTLINFMTGGEIGAISSPVDFITRFTPLICTWCYLNMLEANWEELRRDEICNSDKVKDTNWKKVFVALDASEEEEESPSTRKVNYFALVAFIWSLAVGYVSIHAFLSETCASPLQRRHCIMNSSPWFESPEGCTCLNLHYDCRQPHHQVDLETTDLFQHYSDQVRKLKIRHCPITNLPKSIEKLTNVLTLDLEHLQIEEFAIELKKLRHLMILVIIYTPLNALPDDLPDSIVMLLSKSTNLTSIPDLQNLVMIDMSMNPYFQRLPDHFYRLSPLQLISLRNNSIPEIHNHIQHMRRLQQLALSGNRITRLPPSIAKLPQLRHLHVDGNFIKELPWTKQEVVQWNINPEGMKRSHLLYTEISLAHNPICLPPSEFAEISACAAPCSVGCVGAFENSSYCDPVCNVKSCNFSNGHC